MLTPSNNVRLEACPHCGTSREPDQRVPCPLCHSRAYPFIGYNYQHEARAVMRTVAVIAVFVLIALVGGIALFVYWQVQLNAI